MRSRKSYILLGASAVLLFCISPCRLLSQEDEVNPAQDSYVTVSGLVGMLQLYNDNILDYSASDLYKFNNLHLFPRDSTKYSIGKASDGVNVSRLRMGITTPIFEENPTSIRLKYNQSVNFSNTIRNYVTWGVEVKQYFLQHNALTIGVNVLPHYYLRNLFYNHQARNPFRLRNRYVETFLNRKGVSIELEREFSRRINVTLRYGNEFTEYNPEFSERNNRGKDIMLSGEYRLSRLFNVNGLYQYSFARADGRDNPDSSYADISSRTHRFGTGFDVYFRHLIGIPLKVSSDIIYEKQIFLESPERAYDPVTNPKGDKYHYGRVDNLYRIVTRIRYRLFRNFDLALQYLWEDNETNLAETGDTGTYQVHQVGISTEYSF